MSIKNGDMPAMPLFSSEAKPCQVRDKSTQSTLDASGLTKRETFAMNAPDMPDWFKLQNEFTGLSAESVLTSEELEDFAEYCKDNYGYERFSEGEKASSKFGKLFQEAASNHSNAVFFKWRTHYADALLAQLEEKGE